VGNIFEFESSGILKQNQFVIGAMNRLNRSFTLFANYVLGEARSDTDGVGAFPANTYDLRNEFGRSSLDVRHRATVGGSITLPWEVSVSPLLIASSGAPFNITTGIDANGDTLATERPAFATDLTRPGVRVTPFGNFDLDPGPDQQIIPRNFGSGPSYFMTHLRLSKAINLSKKGSEQKRLTISIFVSNLLNNTNLEAPVGNLSSPLFGQSTSIKNSASAGLPGNAASNRRIDLQVRYNF
jgi:hypothetical protein